MSGISPQEAAKKVDAYKTAVMDEIQARCTAMLDKILGLMIEYRLAAENAHNFTGNFMNSMVVALYRQGLLVEARYSFDDPDVGKPLFEKMSGKRVYEFLYDYDGGDYWNRAPGDMSGKYWAEVKTDKGLGMVDAQHFTSQYQPKASNLFEIVVAYTTEYALFIERVRQSTGILGVYDMFPSVAKTFLRLGKSN